MERGALMVICGKSLIIAATAILFFLPAHVYSQGGQPRQVLAVPTFSYDGSVWIEQLGGAATDAFISRMRMDGDFILPNREDVDELLSQHGVDEPYGAPLARLSFVFTRIGAAYAIVGRITAIQQTEEALGRVIVRITLDAQIIDPSGPFIITSERIEVDVKRKDLLTEESPWDAKEAKKIFSSCISRLRQRVRSTFRTITMM